VTVPPTRSGTGAEILRLGFVCELLLGHSTFFDQVRRVAEADPSIELVAMPIAFEASGRFDRFPPMSNWTVRASLRARTALRTAGPLDALIIHTQTAALGALSVMRQVPTLLSTDATPANMDELGAAYGHATSASPVERVKRRALTRVFSAAAASVVWSDWTRTSLLNGYGVDPQRVHVVPPGLPVTPPPTRTPRDPGPLRVLFVGGDFTRKGGPELLAATEGRDVEVHIVTRERLEVRPGVVVHRGLSAGDPELRALYVRADVFALPTHGDAYGWVLLEAMEAGLPVISTPVGPIREVVADGETGLLVPPGDIRSLGAALDRLLSSEDLRRAMGAAGRSRFEQRHDSSVNVGRILELARRAATANPSSRPGVANG
jgi:glycosyltransferase involved in cell wall biosynthesis